MSKASKTAPETPAQRPRSVTLCAIALLLSGVMAIVASLALYGLHSYLVTSTTKAQPKPVLTTAQVSAQGQGVGQYLGGQLKPGPLSAAQVDATATGVQQYLTSHLPTRNMTSSQIKDQASKAHDAVVTELDNLHGTLGSAQVATVSNDVQKTVSDNLTTFQKSQKKPLTAKQIQDQANRTPTSQLIASIVLMIALTFIAVGAWRGRYWARWGVLIVWVLCTFTGTLAGLNSIIMLGGSVPNAFKIPAGLSGLLAIAAVALAMMRPSVAYFALNKPVPVPGAPQRRGLFGPRPVPAGNARAGGARTAATTRPARTPSAAEPKAAAPKAGDRSRAKKRTSSESVRIGAELARSRAKAASKSRRSDG